MRIRIHAMQFVCCDGCLGASSARDHGQRGPNAMAGVNQCSVDDRAKRSYRTKRMVFVGTARHNERGQLRWIVRLGNLGVRVFSRTPTARGAGRSGLACVPVSQIFGVKFLSSLWACCLDRQFVRPRLIELAGSDVILPDIVVPQAVRVPPKARAGRLTRPR